MKSVKQTVIVVLATGALSSCVPVPSYTVDPYAGTLYKCLDIQGTYEMQNYYRDFPHGDVTLPLLPRRTGALLAQAEREKKIILWEDIIKASGEKKRKYKKSWFSVRFIDDQHWEGVIFTEDRQSFTAIVNMQEKETYPWSQEGGDTCDATSWQKAFSYVLSGEGRSSKTRIYYKTTKLSDGMLKTEAKYDSWGGVGGLYFPNKDSAVKFAYFRRVDLTVDDIRANNEKAKKAIAQYDEVATSPPPAN